MTSTAKPEVPPRVDEHPPTFDEVYAAHYADVAVRLYLYLSDRQEAQDIAQEAFCRALARWKTLAGYDDPVAWIRRVAWNFAHARAEALREIRPPGAAAAHRTVRRRRVTAVVAAACAVVLVAAGVYAVSHPENSLGKAPTAAVPSTHKDVALAAVRAGSTQPAVEDAAPVDGAYQRSVPTYQNSVTLRVACAGTGHLTFAVKVKVNAVGATVLGNMVKATVTCGSNPVVVVRKFQAQLFISALVFQVSDAASAKGHAWFAYRLAGSFGSPLAPDDKASDPDAALQAAGRFMRGRAFGDSVPGQALTAPKINLRPGKDYRLAVACAGEGTVTAAMSWGGELRATTTVTCAWPPAMSIIPVTGTAGGGQATVLYLQQTGPPKELARIAGGVSES